MLSAEDVLAFLRSGGDHSLEGHPVLGDLLQSGATFRRWVRIRDGVFKGRVELAQCRFLRGVDFTGCHFEGGLYLSDARIDGPLVLDRRVRIGVVSDATEQPGGSRPDGPTPTVADFTRLRVAGSLSLVDAEIFGGIACAHAQVESELRLVRTQVHGEVSLRGARLGELRMDGRGDPLPGAPREAPTEPTALPVRVTGDLDLTSTNVRGDMSLVDVEIGGQTILQTAEIGGNLVCKPSSPSGACHFGKQAQFLGLRVAGAVDLSETRFDNDLILTKARIGSDVTLRRVNLQGNAQCEGINVGGTLNGSGATIGEGKVLFLQHASVGGAIKLITDSDESGSRRCRIGADVWLLGATVGGAVDLSGVEIGGNLIMQGARVGQSLWAMMAGGFAPTIEGNVVLRNAEFSGEVSLLGITIGGFLSLDGTSLGGLTVAPGWDDTSGWILARPGVRGPISAVASVVHKHARLLALDVGRVDPAAPASAEDASVSFVGAHITGPLLLRDPRYADEYLRARKAEPRGNRIPEEREKQLPVEFRLERTHISRDLRLSGAQISGDVVLDGVRSGQLDLRNVNAGANVYCRPIETEGPAEGGGPPSTRASAQGVDFRALQTGGDVDLSGLDVAQDLSLDGARIRGSLTLFSRGGRVTESSTDGELRGKRFTAIGQKLKMEAAEVSHVVLSGLSFGEEEGARTPRWRRTWNRVYRWYTMEDAPLHCLPKISPAPRPSGDSSERVSLERARISRLEIVRPLPATNLCDAVVGSWQVKDEDRNFFLDLLRRSHPFRKSNYIGIEGDLRNKGKDEEADRVHVEMRRRDRKHTRSHLRRLRDGFFDWTTRYGTTSWRLFWLAVILVVCSVLIFRNPSHVQYRVEVVSSSDSLPASAPPHVVHPDTAWHWDDLALLVTRLHVPMVALGVGEDVEPSGRGPRGWAAAVVLLSWIMWPLFIASVSGFLRKRS